MDIGRHKLLSLVVAIAACCALLGTVGSAGAEGVAPTEGPWTGITSAGLAVSFRVEGGNVVNATFGFESGPCGNQVSHVANTDPIDAGGHWKFEDPAGPIIEGTFSTAGKVEGIVSTINRAGPHCHGTEATFTAIPGNVPPPSPPQMYVVQNPRTGHKAKMPTEMTIGKGLSFYWMTLRWQNYGKSTTKATGWATVRRYKKEWSPRVTAWFRAPIADGPGKELYSYMRYRLSGHVPAHYPRTGWFKYGRHGVVASSKN